MYGLHGSLKTVPGQREVLLGHLLQGADQLRDFEGCYLYVISLDPTDEDKLWVTEVWRSQDDHRASLELQAIKDIITAARPILAGMPDSMELLPQGGKGLPLNMA
ncbi:MAG: antibiotic biosynthesis monooxygenase [Anaerolineae bacterium]